MRKVKSRQPPMKEPINTIMVLCSQHLEVKIFIFNLPTDRTLPLPTKNDILVLSVQNICLLKINIYTCVCIYIHRYNNTHTHTITYWLNIYLLKSTFWVRSDKC